MEKEDFQSLLKKTENAAKNKFPNETWEKVQENLFVAESRGKQSKSEILKLEKEIAQAKILADSGHVIFLTPETGKGKHFDGLIDGEHTLELKNVTGNLHSVGRNFRDGAKKAENVFLLIASDYLKQDVFSKIRGELKTLQKSTSKILIKKAFIKINKEQIYEIDLNDML